MLRSWGSYTNGFSNYDFLYSFFSGYGKTVSHVVIGLKTAKGTKQLKLDPSIYESLQKEKVEVGDVIYIEANSGAVKVCPNIRNVFLNYQAQLSVFCNLGIAV